MRNFDKVHVTSADKNKERKTHRQRLGEGKKRAADDRETLKQSKNPYRQMVARLRKAKGLPLIAKYAY